jgi:hypothetical protein
MKLFSFFLALLCALSFNAAAAQSVAERFEALTYAGKFSALEEIKADVLANTDTLEQGEFLLYAARLDERAPVEISALLARNILLYIYTNKLSHNPQNTTAASVLDTQVKEAKQALELFKNFYIVSKIKPVENMPSDTERTIKEFINNSICPSIRTVAKENKALYERAIERLSDERAITSLKEALKDGELSIKAKTIEENCFN